MGRNMEDFHSGSGRKFGPQNDIPLTKDVFKRVNVVSHPEQFGEDEELDRQLAADDTRTHQHPHEMHDLPAHQAVHTTQDTVDRAGIRSYIDKPNNPEHWTEEGYDAPEVYHHQGKMWIYEGHHRIIASRLRGEPSIKVHFWDTGE